MNDISDDFYNSLNKMFNNSFPSHVRSLQINMDVQSPLTITITYYPDTLSKEPIETKFGLIEYPEEFSFKKDI